MQCNDALNIKPEYNKNRSKENYFNKKKVYMMHRQKWLKKTWAGHIQRRCDNRKLL